MKKYTAYTSARVQFYCGCNPKYIRDYWKKNRVKSDVGFLGYSDVDSTEIKRKRPPEVVSLLESSGGGQA